MILEEWLKISENVVKCKVIIMDEKKEAYNDYLNKLRVYEYLRKMSVISIDVSDNGIIIEVGNETKKNDFKTEEFYISLKIPQKIIELELNSVGEFLGFPFFLRREESNLEIILMHEYPKGTHLFVELPPKSRAADGSKEIFLTIEKIEELLKQGFKWFHESQYDILW